MSPSSHGSHGSQDSMPGGTGSVWLALLTLTACPPPSPSDARTAPPSAAASTAAASNPAVAPPTSPLPASAPTPPPVALTSCASAGPLACSVAPSPSADLCKQNARCMLQRVATPHDFDGLDISPDPDAPPGAGEATLAARATAPRGSGIESIAVLNVIAENGVGMIQSGATYLVAERAEGACLIDVIHDWERRPSYVEVDLDTHWQPAATGFRLDLRSRRIVHEPLDESESASGVSDALSDTCVSLAYDVVDGRFARVSRRSAPGACAKAPG